MFFLLRPLEKKIDDLSLKVENLFSKLDQIHKIELWNQQELLTVTEKLGKLETVASQPVEKGEKNQIESDLDNDIEITEDMRVPIVNGIKVRFENEKTSKQIRLSPLPAVK